MFNASNTVVIFSPCSNPSAAAAAWALALSYATAAKGEASRCVVIMLFCVLWDCTVLWAL